MFKRFLTQRWLRFRVWFYHWIHPSRVTGRLQRLQRLQLETELHRQHNQSLVRDNDKLRQDLFMTQDDLKNAIAVVSYLQTELVSEKQHNAKLRKCLSPQAGPIG